MATGMEAVSFVSVLSVFGSCGWAYGFAEACVSTGAGWNIRVGSVSSCRSISGFCLSAAGAGSLERLRPCTAAALSPDAPSDCEGAVDSELIYGIGGAPTPGPCFFRQFANSVSSGCWQMRVYCPSLAVFGMFSPLNT
jgi:hypothetical protein